MLGVEEVVDFSSDASASSLSRERARRMRFAPFWKHCLAMAAPMPMEAPVMRMFWPWSDIAMLCGMGLDGWWISKEEERRGSKEDETGVLMYAAGWMTYCGVRFAWQETCRLFL